MFWTVFKSESILRSCCWDKEHQSLLTIYSHFVLLLVKLHDVRVAGELRNLNIFKVFDLGEIIVVWVVELWMINVAVGRTQLPSQVVSVRVEFMALFLAFNFTKSAFVCDCSGMN